MFLSLLELCKSVKILHQIHARLVLHGLHHNPSLSSHLITHYARLNHPRLSLQVLHSTPHHPLLFNAAVAAMASHSRLSDALRFYKEMLLLGPDYLHGNETENKVVCPTREVYGLLLERLMPLRCADMVLCHMVKFGVLGRFGRVGLGSGGDALEVFDGVRDKGLDCRKGCSPEAFVDSTTLAGLLRECNDDSVGEILHGLVVVGGWADENLVGTALLTMYLKIRCLEKARAVFSSVSRRDCVLWNIMIAGCSRNGLPEEALDLLVQMGKVGVRADFYTVIAGLSSVASLRSLNPGKEIHAYAIRSGSNSQVSVHNALIDMYCECNDLRYARSVFDNLRENKTIISWSSMIKGYQKNDHCSNALLLFDMMRIDELKPDPITIINVLPACVNLAALQRVRSIHSYVVKQGFNSLVSLATALLVSYAKSGYIEMAQKMFDALENHQKDLILWNSMINAYAKHGNWYRCFEMYNQMKSSKLKPDKLTFLGLLTATVSSGLLEEGKLCFREMTEIYKYQPGKEHYACMVDLLGRFGHLTDAFELIESMPVEADAQVWGPLLSACKLHSEIELAEFAAGRLIEMEPKNAGNFVLLSNIYAAAGKWDGVAKMRKFLRGGGLKKTPGSSWLEINGVVHEFRVADVSHPKSGEIFCLLSVMEYEIKMDRDDDDVEIMDAFS